MTIPDFINGAFEALAGIAVLNHCRAAAKHRQIKGVSIVSTIFFTSWGVWNLWYYPHLNQWASFTGGLFILMANCIWITLMFRYRKN